MIVREDACGNDCTDLNGCDFVEEKEVASYLPKSVPKALGSEPTMPAHDGSSRGRVWPC